MRYFICLCLQLQIYCADNIQGIFGERPEDSRILDPLVYILRYQMSDIRRNLMLVVMLMACDDDDAMMIHAAAGDVEVVMMILLK